MFRLLLSILPPLLGLVLGVVIAMNQKLVVTEELSIFLAVALMITLDLLVEGVSQFFSRRFSFRAMLLTYLLNLLFAYLILTVGTLMHIDLYIAIFIVFGIKLFSNLSYISQKFFSKWQI